MSYIPNRSLRLTCSADARTSIVLRCSKRDEHANKLRALYEDEDEEEEGQRKGAYADCLMFSEWLVDIPGTLSTDWVMMPCPEGRRCLVVATKVGSM